MAKQAGPVLFTGTIDGIIFYKLGNQYYARSKGSYKSARHIRRNPKYQRTMEKADQFGRASQLVKEVYYSHLPRAVRKHGLYGKLTGLVNGFLQQGKSRAEVRDLLITHCQLLAAAVTPTAAQQPPLSTSEQPSPNNEQPPTVNPQPSSVNQQLSAVNSHDQRSTLNCQRPKQARYLSRWKVKPNGRLHIPHPVTGNQIALSTLQSTIYATRHG